MRRRLIVAGAFGLSVALCAALVVPAIAHKERFKTRVTIQEVKPNQKYEGEVKSRLQACERRRPMQMYYDDPAGSDIPVGDSFRSDRQGHWEQELLAPGSQYYVIATRVVKRPGDHKHVCKSDRSRTTDQ
jgi:hypothetical protein